MKKKQGTISSGALLFYEQANDFMKKGQFKQAIRLYNRAIEIAPNFSLAYSMKRIAEKNLKRTSLSQLRDDPVHSLNGLVFLLFLIVFIIYLNNII